MPNFKKTFPTLTVAERELLDLHLASMTRVQRPYLTDLLTGVLNDAPVVEKVGNDAWRELNVDKGSVYEDESTRSRKAGSSQVETLRIFLKDRFAPAFKNAFGVDYPALDAIKIADGLEPNLVDIWRIR